MTNVESLVGIQLQHSDHYCPELGTVPVGQRRVLAFSDSLE